MSTTLMHIEHHPTDFTVPTWTYHEIADTADIAIRNDETLDRAYRNDPAQINILRNLLADTDEPFTTDHDAVNRFADVLESDAFRQAGGHELADLAGDLAEGLRGLTSTHETVHLRLL